MPKHLYFNPRNFEQLVLSGVLIQFFKTDIEVHSHEQSQILRFVQGENVVENNIENILMFANRISGHKIFGRNWQQQAIINMINGVCKDIEKKLSVCSESSQLTEKIEHLNTFWFNKSNQWLKKKFFYCHLQLLTLSFSIQEKFPEILTKYQCFVELRRLFIEQKLLSKTSLIAMFKHPENKYQEFDLFPQLESSVHEVRRSMGSTYGEDMGEFIKDNLESSYVEITAQEMDINEMKQQTTTEALTQKQSEMITVQTEQNHAVHIESHQHNTHQTVYNAHNNPIQGQSNVSTLNNTDQSSYIPSPEKQASKVDPQQIVISHINQQQSAIVTNMTSDIEVIQQETHHVSSEIQVKVQGHQHEHEDHQNKQQNNQEKHQIGQPQKIKISLKESFSQNLTKPLQYSSKNLVDQEVAMTQNKQVQSKHQEPLSQQPASQAIPNHENHETKQEQHKQLKRANATFQLKKQALIEEAQSQNYVSQENLDHKKEKPAIKNQEHQQIKPTSKKNEQKIVQPLQQQKNKAPQSQSHNASVKGPKSAMENKKIKPKEQTVVVHKETCKCEIF